MHLVNNTGFSENKYDQIPSVTDGICFFFYISDPGLRLHMETAEKRKCSVFQFIASPSSHCIDFMSIQIFYVKVMLNDLGGGFLPMKGKQTVMLQNYFPSNSICLGLNPNFKFHPVMQHVRLLRMIRFIIVCILYFM